MWQGGTGCIDQWNLIKDLLDVTGRLAAVQEINSTVHILLSVCRMGGGEIYIVFCEGVGMYWKNPFWNDLDKRVEPELYLTVQNIVSA